MFKKKIYFHADDYGRSSQISKNILSCLRFGSLNSVSIIINKNLKHHNKLKKLKKIKKKLHINLTDRPYLKNKNKKLFQKLSFLKLLLMNDQDKKKIFEEIDYQIVQFIKIYKPKNLMIDGHEHIQMIPWIFNYLYKKKKFYKIYEIRNSNESIIIPRLNDLINLKYYRNLLAFFVVKFLFYINKRKNLNSPTFTGLIYSGIQDYKTLKRTSIFYKNKKFNKLEILIHPGYCDHKEKLQFDKSYFNFYNSNSRKVEYNLCFSKEINKLLNFI